MASLSSVEMHRYHSPILKKFYSDILKRTSGIDHEISKINVRNPGLKFPGNGMNWRLVRVEFTSKIVAPFYLLAKMVFQNAEHEAFSGARNSLQMEVAFLKKYVPAAKKLCKDKGVSESLVTDIYPKYYYGDDKILITEDVEKSQDYEKSNEEPHDFDTAMLALKTLAIHHAIAYSLVREMGGAEYFFQEFPYFNFDFTKTEYIKSMETVLHSAVSANMTIVETNSDRVEGSSEVITDLNTLTPIHCSFVEWTRKSLEVEKDEFVVLNHGGYWNPALRFLKDSKERKYVQMKIIDFSDCCYNSPTVDVAYYLFICVNTEVRQKQLEELLRHYFKVFTNLCSDFGYPVDLTYDKFFTQYRKKLYFPLMTSFLSRYGLIKEMLREENQMISLGIYTEDWDRAVLMHGLKYVEDKSKKGIATAREIVSVMKEYKSLSLFQPQTVIK